jgi:hypothetical protein
MQQGGDKLSVDYALMSSFWKGSSISVLVQHELS